MPVRTGVWDKFSDTTHPPSQRTTLLELIQAFLSYARSHELPDNAALAVTRALQEAFPCKARQGFHGLGGAVTFDSPLLETRQNICSRWEAVNYALSSISGNHVSIYCVELYGGTFALEWLPYINSQSTNPALLKP